MTPDKTLFEETTRRALACLPSNGWIEYATDAFQRTVLTWDVLRRRGNQYLEHVVQDLPPVLVFSYDVVLDGQTLDRPVNYLLLRIRPDPAHPVDPAKRPFVVVDPRAGHGPGIGGFKPDSQIGLAVKNGYPCYFVSFKPQPVPGQTIEDVAKAEAAFLAKVAELHPEAEDRPVVIGNCQAGWAVAMLSAAAPELMSVVILNGAPLSYWAGEIGHNPMRYVGGLLGGTWLASLASDLGDGLFDGANLVTNFESLDPANTLWKKPYNLYSNIDDEADRYLVFERWWGGHFLLTKDEILFITDELFVGNKLALGELRSSSGREVNLRNIKAPVVVFASKGDNITPPQQALNWILDTYDSVDDIRACGQVIIYMLHESVGHLGIFVSAKVAKREHRAMVDNLDVISTLPPGLYEMTIAEDGGTRSVGFQKREFSDLRALDDSRRDEPFFLPVARVSDLNRAAYEQFLSPWVRMAANPVTGELLRRTNTHRLVHWLWSDVNPAMALVTDAAKQIRRDRRPVENGNIFRAGERVFSDLMVNWLDHFRDCRDKAAETLFYGLYAPLMQGFREQEHDLLTRRSQRLASSSRAARETLEREILPHMADGGRPEAALRMALWLGRRRPVIDAERFRLAERAAARDPLFAGLDSRGMRDMLRRQFFLLMLDEDQAIAALPRLLASSADREAALALVERIGSEIGGLSAEQQDDLDALRDLLALPSPAGERAATGRRSRRTEARPDNPPPRPLH